MTVRLELLNFISRWGEPIDPIEVPQSYFDEYGDQLPELMLDLWREIGFAGFGNGLLWVCDPHAWQPIVDTWLDGVELPDHYRGGQIPIFRTAYGEINCFKQGLGQKLTIKPALSKIALFRPGPVAGQKWIDMDISSFLRFPARQFLLHADPSDDGEDYQEDLFPRIVERLGRTTSDTIYTFEPSVQEGGDIRLEYAKTADATVELTRLRSLKAPRTRVF
ncbi:GAD-like domain-containing protein [Mycolicibacterium peregrinum]|uniref:GAD-related domain-containing protein n=1 Tax=Mycolicibacterium peregrinum TaxID=43304 RepID=A0A1A0WFJ4_MYCPR|nr:GAD-like domain-containing protein [Mycolicibacterium peregrinum]OBB97162.1 hypothetical protein A5779_15515 [Mycolicibacterium peregrinum]